MSLPVAVILKRLATDFFVFCMEMNAPPAFVGARDALVLPANTATAAPALASMCGRARDRWAMSRVQRRFARSWQIPWRPLES